MHKTFKACLIATFFLSEIASAQVAKPDDAINRAFESLESPSRVVQQGKGDDPLQEIERHRERRTEALRQEQARARAAAAWSEKTTKIRKLAESQCSNGTVVACAPQACGAKPDEQICTKVSRSKPPEGGGLWLNVSKCVEEESNPAFVVWKSCTTQEAAVCQEKTAEIQRCVSRETVRLTKLDQQGKTAQAADAKRGTKPVYTFQRSLNWKSWGGDLSQRSAEQDLQRTQARDSAWHFAGTLSHRIVATHPLVCKTSLSMGKEYWTCSVKVDYEVMSHRNPGGRAHPVGKAASK